MQKLSRSHVHKDGHPLPSIWTVQCPSHPLHMLTTERPSLTFSITSQTCRLDAGSSPVVGLSRMRMSGLPIQAMATDRRLLMPPDRAFDLRLRASWRLTCSVQNFTAVIGTCTCVSKYHPSFLSCISQTSRYLNAPSLVMRTKSAVLYHSLLWLGWYMFM